MQHYERPTFETNSPPKKDKQHFVLPKKILRAGALAATLMSGQEAKAATAQELQPSAIQAETHSSRPYIEYDSSAHSIMLKTGVLFRGNGLYLAHIKKGIDLTQNGSVIGVEVIAQGDRDLLVRIHKKPGTHGDPDKITEIKISNGLLLVTPEQPKK